MNQETLYCITQYTIIVYNYTHFEFIASSHNTNYIYILRESNDCHFLLILLHKKIIEFELQIYYLKSRSSFAVLELLFTLFSLDLVDSLLNMFLPQLLFFVFLLLFLISPLSPLLTTFAFLFLDSF